MKTCNKCGEEKEDELCVKRGNICKECNNKIRREMYKNNTDYADKIKKKQRERNKKPLEIDNPDEIKYCKYCETNKKIVMFRKSRAKCLDCERTDGRKYRQGEVGKTKAKKWASDNKEQMQKLQSDWYQQNKPKINEKYVKKYNTNNNFKIHKRCKTLMNLALKNKIKKETQKKKKSGSDSDPDTDTESELESTLKSEIKNDEKTTRNYIGCTDSFFVSWMKFCLSRDKDDYMTLDTHGTYWHIDHVIPLTFFETHNDDIYLNWRNTMPLKASKNMEKKATIDKKQIKRHVKNLKKFHTKNKLKLPEEFDDLYAKHLIMSGNSLEPETTTNA